MNLLIVDDEPIVLQGILNGVQWELLRFQNVYTSQSVEEARETLDQAKIDVLLTDIELTGSSGLDLIEWVNKTHPGIMCIVLSCHDEFNFAQRAVRLACADYVLKPVPYEILTETLKKTIDRVIAQQGRSAMEDYGKAYFTYLKGEKNRQPEEDPVDASLRYIKAHISEELSVEQLAKLVSVSPRHLSRLFQKKLGMNVMDCITKERMIIAAELLSDPAISITLVSDRCGYCNYSYFIRQFKKYHGITPGEYQKQQQ